MRKTEYYGNIEKTRAKVTEILDRSGLAYFISLQEKAEKKTPTMIYRDIHGAIGNSHFSYELTVKAVVAALREYNKSGQIKWLKFIAKELGYEIEIKE